MTQHVQCVGGGHAPVAVEIGGDEILWLCGAKGRVQPHSDAQHVKRVAGGDRGVARAVGQVRVEMP